MKIFSERFKFLLFAAVFFITAIAVHKSSLLVQTPEKLTRQFKRELQQKDAELEKVLSSFISSKDNKSYGNLPLQKQLELENLYSSEGIALFAFENGSMVFWSHNAVPVLNFSDIRILDTPVIQLQNGWYRVKLHKEKNLIVAALALIKNEYTHQNKYLENKFYADFCLPPDVTLNLNRTASLNPISDSSGQFLFSLVFEKQFYVSPAKIYIVIACLISGIFFLVLFFQRETEKALRNKILPLFLFAGALVAFRLLTILLEIPPLIYKMELFNPVHYATSLIFPSLGDFLINALLLCYLFYFINQKVSFKPFINSMISNRPERNVTGVFVILFVLAFAWLISMSLRGLVIHSNIIFNLNNIFELNYLSLTGFLISGLLLLSFYLASNKAINILIQLKIGNRVLLLMLFICIIPFLLLSFFEAGSLDPVLLLWPLPVLLIIWWIKGRQSKVYNFSSVLIIVLVFSIYASHIFNTYSSVKERENREVLIQKLAREKDHVAEFLFKEIEVKLAADSNIRVLAEDFWQNREGLENYLKDKYFTGFWNKFDMQATVCKPEDSLLIASTVSQVKCADFFESMIRDFGHPVNGSNLYYLENNSGRISYLAKLALNLPAGTKNFSFLFLEIDSKFMPEGTGYPELLMDASEITHIPDMRNYSFAKYKDGQLISKSGSYPYKVSLFTYPVVNNLFFFEEEGFSHLAYIPEPSTAIVLSRPSENSIGRLTAFSYIFAFFSLLLLLVLFLRQSPKDYALIWYDFKTRIQSILIGTVILSILLFGAGTIYYIQKQYDQKNSNLISEKIRSVLIELEHKLSGEPSLGLHMEDYLTPLLIKFSDVFFTDVNLYDLNGNLLASSQKEIFDKGLSGRKMNAAAFTMMSRENKTEFIQEENIGKLNYLSAYIPFYNFNGELLAYLNLPYFAKQNELESEISFFLITLINIYVLLFVLSVIIAILLSNLITGPLQMIRTKLRDVKLGKSNEFIEWKGEDEIGSLVKEYNQMILELSESAERLAQSEREYAWREMAKQIAHEIKNPLTPMKLSVQHLERARKDKAPDFDHKLERFTKTLIEQIDTLSNIAGEFSNFAKMPSKRPENLDLKELLRNVADLFKGPGQTTIIMESEENKNFIVKADKSQLLRVFNNLIKNAVQSIPFEQEGKILIRIAEEKNSHALISIKDNGCGINKEQREKIFTPNFTTKTTGTGLGLAIVKTIVEDSGGKVWFETSEQSGTEFFVLLPMEKNFKFEI